MKRVRTIVTMVLILTLMLNGDVIVLAMETGFLTETLSEKDKNTFITNVKITMLDSEPQKVAIECFDINEKGIIALGTEKKTIVVYDIDGNFQYGYGFNCDGNFGLEWDKDDIIIYFVRGDVAATISSEGKIKNVLRIKNTIENNSYWNHAVFSIKRSIGDCEYILKNDMGVLNIFASSYSQLIMIDQYGNEKIIYDVNSTELAKSIIIGIGVVLFAGIVFGGIIRELVKLKRKN